jgi:hypothetical protein
VPAGECAEEGREGKGVMGSEGGRERVRDGGRDRGREKCKKKGAQGLVQLNTTTNLEARFSSTNY